NVIPLSYKGGGAGKGFSTVSGFAQTGASLFMADRKPYIFDPKSGKKQFIAGIKETKKGIAVRLRKDFPVRVHGTTALVRSTDSFLRAFDLGSAKEMWRYQDLRDSRKYVYDLPVCGDRVLVPVLYPDLEISTEMKFPTDDGEGEATLPGRISTRLDPLTHGSLLSLFVSTGPKTHILSTIDLKEGRLLYSMELPSTRCAASGGFIACRKKKTLQIFSHSTGEALMKKVFDKTVSFVSVAGDRVAVELADKTLVLLTAQEGKIIWSGKIVIKNAPSHLASLVYGQGDRIALLLKTHWERSPRLNRYYLRIFSTTMPDSHVDIKLGVPSENRRENRISTDRGQVNCNTPVWAEGSTIVSAVDGMYQTIDVNKARQLRSFSLLGKGNSPVSLVAHRSKVALIERGRWLTAVSAAHKTLWTRPMREQEVADVSDTHAVILLKEGFEVIELATGKPVEKPFKNDAGMKFIAFYKGAWFLKQGKKQLLLEGGSIKNTEALPSRYFNVGGLDIVAFTKRSSLKEKASWAAVDLASGQVQWKYTFSKHPSDLGTARSIADLLPRQAKGDAPWWAVGTPKGFLVPGAAHRCLYLVEPVRGKVTWVRCFHRLGPPPLVFPTGDILLSAVGPFAEPGKPFKGETPGDEGTLAVFLIQASSMKVSRIYGHPSLSIHLPLKVPGPNAPFVVTAFAERKTVKNSILKAFTLKWGPL
ncbi:PQQ-binding-like beta-propeller repeat protein, partial [Myxococcota bacterium]|nr:PQQ-binding-like beta-propeller repeat protein [Myxococcota bacterium]